MRHMAFLLLVSLPLAAGAQPAVSVQTAPQVCVWSEAGDGPSTAWRISEILADVEAYWAPEAIPEDCIPVAVSSYCAPPGTDGQPTASIMLYGTAESMHRDLGRFDVAGLAMSVDPFVSPGLRACRLADRFGAGMVIEGLSLLFVCCYPDEDWERIAAHELVHALQFAHWSLDPDAVTDAHRTLLTEGAARHTEYALGFLDRFDLHTAGPVSIWLSEGGDIQEPPWFLRYDIGASLVGALVRRAGPETLWSVASGPCRSSLLNR